MKPSNGDPASPSRASRCAPEAAGASSPSVTPAIAWQPIETAPRDRDVLLFVQWIDARTYEIGHYHGPRTWEIRAGTRQTVRATHWMPIPEPPAQGIEARSGETEGLDPKGESPVAEGHAPEGDRDV